MTRAGFVQNKTVFVQFFFHSENEPDQETTILSIINRDTDPNKSKDNSNVIVVVIVATSVVAAVAVTVVVVVAVVAIVVVVVVVNDVIEKTQDLMEIKTIILD